MNCEPIALTYSEYQIILPSGEKIWEGHEFLFHDNQSECVVVEIEVGHVVIECGLSSARYEAHELWPGAVIEPSERVAGQWDQYPQAPRPVTAEAGGGE